MLNICLKYVKPIEIINFFQTNNLSLDTRFTYDAKFWELKSSVLNYTLSIFPNAIITGMNIDVDDNVNIRCDNVMHLEINGKSLKSFGSHCQLTKRMLCRYINVISVSIKKFSIWNNDAFSTLDGCQKLRYLNVSFCISLLVLGRCANIKYLDMRGCNYRITNVKILLKLCSSEELIVSDDSGYNGSGGNLFHEAICSQQ